MPCCSCVLARMTLPSCPAVTPLVEHYQRAFSASISRCNRLKADFQPVWSKNCNALLRRHVVMSTPSSEGQKPDSISPLLCVHGGPNEQYIFHSRRHRQPLRDNQHAW